MSDPLLSPEGERLLREMRNSGELCCIEILSDFNYVWDVGFVRFDLSTPDTHTKERHLYSYENLNEAIKAAYDLWKAGPPAKPEASKPLRAGIVAFD
jgi:hypothetical protein